MSRLIKTFSIPSELDPIYEQFRKILEKDKKVVINGKEVEAKNASQAFTQFMVQYVRVHGNNPQPRLDLFTDAEALALPALGEPLRRERLTRMSPETLKDIVKGGKARMEEALGELGRRGAKRYDLTDLREGRAN